MKALIAGASGIVIGIVIVYYGFELVSVPTVVHYREWLWVSLGVLLILAGAAGIFFFGFRRKEASSPEPTPPAA